MERARLALSYWACQIGEADFVTTKLPRFCLWDREKKGVQNRRNGMCEEKVGTSMTQLSRQREREAERAKQGKECMFFRCSEALLNMHPLPDRQDDMWIAGLISEFTDRATRSWMAESHFAAIIRLFLFQYQTWEQVALQVNDLVQKVGWLGCIGRTTRMTLL